MSCHNEGCGCGKFFVGMGLGLMVGAGLGMTVSPSRRQVRRVAHKAAQRVNEVVDDLADATRGHAFSAVKLLFIPGAIFAAIIAASMGKVPLPQKGSSTILLPFQGVS